MAATATHWNLVVDSGTDSELREFLAYNGGDLSTFVEEAVKARIFELSVQQAKRENADVSGEAIEGAVDEALARARGRRQMRGPSDA